MNHLPAISAKLKLFASLEMPVEALKALLSDLAVELDTEEARLSKERRRKRPEIPLHSVECPGKNPEPPVARVLDNLKPLESKEVRNPPISPPLPSSKPLPSEPQGFDAFWAIYPKRDGTADRKGALKAFAPALKRVDLETLLDATRAYAADMKAKGKIGTEFVKQARSWLNGDLWTEYQPKSQGQDCSSGVYVQYGTEQGDAWERFYRTVRKRPPPKDARNGWYFPTEFPTQSPDRSAA